MFKYGNFYCGYYRAIATIAEGRTLHIGCESTGRIRRTLLRLLDTVSQEKIDLAVILKYPDCEWSAVPRQKWGQISQIALI